MVAQPRSRSAHCRARAQSRPSARSPAVRAPRHASGRRAAHTARRAAGSGTSAGRVPLGVTGPCPAREEPPGGRHAPRRGAPVFGCSARSAPSRFAPRAQLCAGRVRADSARTRRYSSRGLGPRSTARARGASAAACARGACGGSARHSRANRARAGLAPCTVAQITTCRRPALASRAPSASARFARPLI